MKHRKILIVIIIILSAIIIALVGIKWYNDKKPEDIIEQTAPPENEAVPPAEQKEEYESPVDFVSLHKQNPDIYSWIRINGTCVDYPIVQKKGDNSYYHRRDFLGNGSWNGCIYTEDYNALDFDDKVTVVYGHNIYSGKMFGDLINYTDPEYFKAHSQMTVYLPQGEKHYELFGAITFDNRHLLHYSDYDEPSQFEELVETLKSTRNLTSAISGDVTVESDDRLVILSTCYYNQKDKRFLVVWRETEEIS